MNNALLDVSAKALQKSLEKGANFQNHHEFGHSEGEAAEEVSTTTSVFQRLLHWASNKNASNTHVATPRLKNKGI